MSIWKKAVSVGTTAALLASLLITAVAPSALAAGTVTNIVYQANGAVAGSAVPTSTTVAFVSFNPESPLQAGTNITLTLPSGTTVGAAPTFSMVQQGGGALTAATTSVAGSVLTLLIPGAAIGSIGGGVTIFYTGGGAITNPTTATSNGILGIAIQSGDTGTLSGITFVAGPAVSLVLSPLTPSVGFGLTQQFTATCLDVNSNVQTCPATTWTAVPLVGGAGTITTAGLFTATAVGTVTVTANAGAGALTQSTVVTVTPVAASVTCTPPGGSLVAGDTVLCAYNPGSTGLPNPTWTQTNFTPAGPVAAPGATFTAVNAGAAPVTGIIAVTGSVNATFTYIISPAAPTSSGTWPGTAAGDVAQGTTSVGTATLTFTEKSANALGASGIGCFTTCYLYVDIVPAAPGTGTVTWAGTPVVAAPDSLGVTVTTVGSRLTIRIRAQDAANIESISISGLKIRASADATPGNVVATLSDNATTPGNLWKAFYTAPTEARGKLVEATGIGATGFLIALDNGSPCNFVAPSGGNALKIAGANAEDVTSASVSVLGFTLPGQQDVTLIPLPGLTKSHGANDVVTQTTGSCPALGATLRIGSPAKVVRALDFFYSNTPTVFPGESNAEVGDLKAEEPAIGFLAKGTTLTYTIATEGVVFSKVPPVYTTGGLVASAAVLSSDRKSIVVTITTASTAADANIWIGDYNGAFKGAPILYDVAATVPGGTFVEVNLTLSGGLLVTGNPAYNAVVFRGISASAPTPTVFIGENNQATGLVTLVEQSAGFFNAGTGSNNVLAVCALGVNYSFTFAPWAKVTSGDLKLREGTGVSPDNIVEGSWNGSCYQWTVWTASTVASTIQIGNSTFTSGPLINVGVNQAPGIVAMDVYSGNGLVNADDTLIATVGFAVAQFRNQVAVTALAQPVIPAGAVTKAGAIQIAETANGQLKSNEDLCFEIMPRGSTGLTQAKYDTLISALNTAQLPIVTASGGLVVGPVSIFNQNCAGRSPIPASASNQAISFSFTVLQQSTTGTGKLVVDNINLITLADAFNGPVLFNVYGYGGSPTRVQFQAQVSNARIGVKSAIAMSAVTALGVPPNQGAWSTSTKVAAANKFITWRFAGGAALAGKTVRIYVAAKNANGGWGPFVNLTGRVADASGNVYFWWRATDAWYSVRAYFPGDASYAPSWSSPRQGRWLS